MTEFLQTNESPLVLPRAVFINHFWESVASGPFRGVSLEETDGLISRHFFASDPLTPLTVEEEQILRAELHRRLFHLLNRPVLRVLSQDPVVYIPPNSEGPDKLTQRLLGEWAYKLAVLEDRPLFLVQQTAVTAIESGRAALSTEQKLKIYSDPEVWEVARVSVDPETLWRTLSWGSRHFFSESGEDSYGVSKDEFDAIVRKVKSRTNRENLRFCDLGGYTGLACREVKDIYPNFEVTNITVTEEPAMWPGINHIFVPAERMPKDFYEKFDIIFSNMSWMYFALPDIALANALQALSVGGYADIEYSGGKSDLDLEMIGRRLKGGMNLLEKLEEEGLISFSFDKGPFRDVPIGILRIEKHKPTNVEALQNI